MTPLIAAMPGNERMANALCESTAAQPLPITCRRFPDGESLVRLDGDCRGRSVALLCTLNDPDPKLLPLWFAARTARELGAARVGLVAPYLAYMRQDARFHAGEALSADAFAVLLRGAFDWVATVDPHLHRRRALSGLFPECAAVSSAALIAQWVRENVSHPLIVGPDTESEQWAAAVAAAAGAPHVVLQKTRLGDREVRIVLPDLSRLADRVPVLVDDIISSGHTLAMAARQLRERGLAAPVCIAVHGLLAGNARALLRDAGCARIITTDTVPDASNGIAIASALAPAVMRLAAGPA